METQGETWYFNEQKDSYAFISAFGYNAGLGIDLKKDDIIHTLDFYTVSARVRIGNFEISLNIGTGDFIDWSMARNLKKDGGR